MKDSTSSRYRRTPKVVEAATWSGHNGADLIEWTNGAFQVDDKVGFLYGVMIEIFDYIYVDDAGKYHVIPVEEFKADFDRLNDEELHLGCRAHVDKITLDKDTKIVLTITGNDDPASVEKALTDFKNVRVFLDLTQTVIQKTVDDAIADKHEEDTASLFEASDEVVEQTPKPPVVTLVPFEPTAEEVVEETAAAEEAVAETAPSGFSMEAPEDESVDRPGDDQPMPRAESTFHTLEKVPAGTFLRLFESEASVMLEKAMAGNMQTKTIEGIRYSAYKNPTGVLTLEVKDTSKDALVGAHTFFGVLGCNFTSRVVGDTTIFAAASLPATK